MSKPVRHTVLITGATGSIGGKLRAHFATRNDVELRLLCINPTGDPSVQTADLSHYDEKWAGAFQGVDTVVHLAGASSTLATWDVVQRLNIDLTLNVYRAAAHHAVGRIVYASSNWVLAGYRFSDERLTPQLPPAPINPYGSSKLFLERAGLDLAARTGISYIALRIGYCQHAPGNVPGPHMEHGVWGQQMWLSDRDLCQGFERAAMTPGIRTAILNLMSDNPGMRWDLEQTHTMIGYSAKDGYRAVDCKEAEEKAEITRAARRTIEGLGRLTAKW